jgi:heme-degrading monooxygenase HmoA
MGESEVQPYYAVIFTSERTTAEPDEYAAMAERMLELARQQPGFLGIESTRGSDGVGTTISYWQDLESIKAWKNVADHQTVQRLGREKWYRNFKVRICRVENEYSFDGPIV